MSHNTLLITLPREGEVVQWQTPKYFLPDTSKYIPLGLLSLQTNAKNDNVEILDAKSQGIGLEETINIINLLNPETLGISAMTFSHYQLQEILKRTSSKYKVVGGPHATRYANKIMNMGADAVFRGVLADNEFAEALKTKREGIIDCFTDINNIDYPKRNKIDNKFYYATGNLFKSNNRMSMFSGVGCPHRCSFCDVQVKIPTRRKPAKVVEEMAYLKTIGAGEVHVYEDNFNTDKSYLEELCEEFDKQKVEVEWCGRAQARIDEDILYNLKQHGLKRLGVGLESLHDDTLRYFNKPQTYNTIRKFMDTTNKVGVEVIGYFIIGAPTETDNYKANMNDMIRDLGINKPLINILQPFPDTKLYTDMLKDGTYKEDHWKNFIDNPTPNYKLPFPFGEAHWNESAKRIEDSIKYFEDLRK